MYGLTTGDKIQLGDTDLHAEIERDSAIYGDKCVFGGGKVDPRFPLSFSSGFVSWYSALLSSRLWLSRAHRCPLIPPWVHLWPPPRRSSTLASSSLTWTVPCLLHLLLCPVRPWSLRYLDGMGQSCGHPSADSLDAVIVDYRGIFKADIGIKLKMALLFPLEKQAIQISWMVYFQI